MNTLISITQTANQHIQKILSKYPNSIGMRIAIKHSGCSGKSYVVSPVSLPDINDQDIVCQSSDITLYIDTESMQYIAGTVIDYVKNNTAITTGTTGKLVFQNPQEKAICGCGESFYV